MPIGCLIRYVHLIQEEPKTTLCLASGKEAGSCHRICVMADTFFSSSWALGFYSSPPDSIAVSVVAVIRVHFDKYRIWDEQASSVQEFIGTSGLWTCESAKSASQSKTKPLEKLKWRDSLILDSCRWSHQFYNVVYGELPGALIWITDRVLM